MKFSSILAFASFALAAPSAVERRQNTAVGAIRSSVNTLDGSTKASVASIQNAIGVIKQSPSTQAAVQAQANIVSELQTITSALVTAANEVSGATTGSAGGVLGNAVILTNAELDILVQTLDTTRGIAVSFTTTANSAARDLTPEALQAVSGELGAIRTSISTLVGPLVGFSNAAAVASTAAGRSTASLINSIQALTVAIARLNSLIGS